MGQKTTKLRFGDEMFTATDEHMCTGDQLNPPDNRNEKAGTAEAFEWCRNSARAYPGARCAQSDPFGFLCIVTNNYERKPYTAEQRQNIERHRQQGWRTEQDYLDIARSGLCRHVDPQTDLAPLNFPLSLISEKLGTDDRVTMQHNMQAALSYYQSTLHTDGLSIKMRHQRLHELKDVLSDPRRFEPVPIGASVHPFEATETEQRIRTARSSCIDKCLDVGWVRMRFPKENELLVKLHESPEVKGTFAGYIMHLNIYTGETIIRPASRVLYEVSRTSGHERRQEIANYQLQLDTTPDYYKEDPVSDLNKAASKRLYGILVAQPGMQNGWDHDPSTGTNVRRRRRYTCEMSFLRRVVQPVCEKFKITVGYLLDLTADGTIISCKTNGDNSIQVPDHYHNEFFKKITHRGALRNRFACLPMETSDYELDVHAQCSTLHNGENQNHKLANHLNLFIPQEKHLKGYYMTGIAASVFRQRLGSPASIPYIAVNMGSPENFGPNFTKPIVSSINTVLHELAHVFIADHSADWRAVMKTLCDHFDEHYGPELRAIADEIGQTPQSIQEAAMGARSFVDSRDYEHRNAWGVFQVFYMRKLKEWFEIDYYDHVS